MLALGQTTNYPRAKPLLKFNIPAAYLISGTSTEPKLISRLKRKSIEKHLSSAACINLLDLQFRTLHKWY